MGNGIKKLFDLSVKNILWMILIYAELLLIVLRDNLLSYIAKNWDYIILILDTISNIIWLQAVTIVLFAIPLIYIVWTETGIKLFSIRRLIAFVISSALFFTLFGNNLPCGDFIALIMGCYFAGLFMLELIKYMQGDEKPKENGPIYEIKNLSGFSVISDTSRMKDVGWGKFADMLTGKLFQTDISKEAFAVAINGEWGSGKTTFLNEIRTRIKGNAYVIDFYPWLSNSPAQIVKDYFALLKTIFDNEDGASSIIDDYVDLIVDMDVESHLTGLAKLIKHRKSLNLEKARKSVEDCIPMDKPVIVMIDDLDRLEKDEIYEVLRLIRNTAKFKNVIYIVAYDKEYICGTLGNKGISSPREYLMKIFQAEIRLPVFEESKLIELLVEELTIQLGEADNGKVEIERFLMSTSKDKLPLSAVLRNFRDIKRFANLIALDITHIEQGKSVYDIHVRDLFVLELVHYRYDHIYKILLEERGKLIQWNKDAELYVLKKVEELPPDVKSDEFLVALLKTLFGTDFTFKPDKRSIRYRYNYINYFSLRPMVNQIGRTDFNTLLRNNDADGIKKEVKIWLESGRDIITSLFIRLKEVSPETLSDKSMDKYLDALFSWAELKEDNNSQRLLPYICMTVFKRQHFQQHKDKEILMHDKLVERIRALIEQGRYLNVASMLRGLYGIVIGYDNEDGEVYLDEYYILEPKEVVGLMSECFNKLAEVYQPTDDDIIDESSLLSQFVKNATTNPIEEASEGRSILCHYAFIDYFRNRASDNDIEKFYSYYCYDTDAELHGAMPDEIRYYVKSKIGKSFGSEVTYRAFIKECFNLTEEQQKQRDKYLENYICPIEKKQR